ncbi:MAG: hypothetical protein ACJ761_11530 [Chloroflexota bacterium]
MATAADGGRGPGPPSVGASIDTGSNSVHLLVATVADHSTEAIADESVFLGLGAAVDERAALGADRREALLVALDGYVSRARELGADTVTIVGTEPLRRAGDAARVVRDVEARLGLTLHVLTHEEEGYLTLLGATGGHAVEQETLVVDVGGGSSELAIVAPGAAPTAVGLRLGCRRLTDQFGTHDPIRPDEIEEMRRVAREAVAGGTPTASPGEVVAVGGTASNLLKVLPERAEQAHLDRDDLRRAIALLGEDTAAAASARYGVNPVRARILPAGAVIVDAILERYGKVDLRVSEGGIREGAILAAARAGSAWRDRLPMLVQGWPS